MNIISNLNDDLLIQVSNSELNLNNILPNQLNTISNSDYDSDSQNGEIDYPDEPGYNNYNNNYNNNYVFEHEHINFDNYNNYPYTDVNINIFNSIQNSQNKIQKIEYVVELPTHIMETIVKKQPNCPICMDSIKFDDKEKEKVKYRNCCGNVFHENCYNTWVEKNNNCPMCRK